MCENTNNDALTYIKNNTILKVIPVLSPSAYDAHTRNNANGININRDFISQTQGETQCAVSLIDNNPDTKMVIDTHNTVFQFAYFTEYTGVLGYLSQEMVLCVLPVLEDHWVELDPTLSGYIPLGNLTKSDVNGDMCDYASNYKNMLSITIEPSRSSSALKNRDFLDI